jgi:hypothetical protein
MMRELNFIESFPGKRHLFDLMNFSEIWKLMMLVHVTSLSHFEAKWGVMAEREIYANGFFEFQIAYIDFSSIVWHFIWNSISNLLLQVSFMGRTRASLYIWEEASITGKLASTFRKRPRGLWQILLRCLFEKQLNWYLFCFLTDADDDLQKKIMGNFPCPDTC